MSQARSVRSFTLSNPSVILLTMVMLKSHVQTKCPGVDFFPSPMTVNYCTVNWIALGST